MYRRIIRKRAGIGRTRVTDFAEEGVFFKTSAYAHVRNFAKKGYVFVPRYGGENLLTIHEISAALTSSDSGSDWASEFAAAAWCR